MNLWWLREITYAQSDGYIRTILTQKEKFALSFWRASRTLFPDQDTKIISVFRVLEACTHANSVA